MQLQPVGQRALPHIALGVEHHGRQIRARLDVHLAQRELRLVFRGDLAAGR